MRLTFFYFTIFVGPAHIVARSIQLRDNEITSAQILQVAPGSDSCPSPSDECATSAQAAPFLNAAMSKYSINSLSEQASILALIAFESGNFKYNINHFPGNPGQGTRNMQSASFNLQYVKSIPELASQTTYTSTDGLNSDQLNQIRALVLPDDYTWASAAWFLTQQSACADARRTLQASNGDEGFTAHMRCVGISDINESRMAYWRAARTALGA
ncbi:BgTH12-01086 [Blumeria graminis f. sp. triticale]|uniref:BgTH12-01086 n=1 Tax=Blumeria graminis f. sp. triticale TaxID=1689686 RepID=A0A9W4GHX3_BLUGR|nr:BgTH12-01086 [Blumeria graminis f. sp. triticale]